MHTMARLNVNQNGAYEADMRRKNQARHARLLDCLNQFVENLGEGFTGKLCIEVPILRGMMGSHTLHTSQRDTTE